ELKKIIADLECLPGMGEVDWKKNRERDKKTSAIKIRLAQLMENDRVEKGLRSALQKINGNLLEELLSVQAYLLSDWKRANAELNYHRFFDINELISMQVEYEDVFESMHELILTSIKQGWVSALRIDHIDGLYDPLQYLFRIQKACGIDKKED